MAAEAVMIIESITIPILVFLTGGFEGGGSGDTFSLS